MQGEWGRNCLRKRHWQHTSDQEVPLIQLYTPLAAGGHQAVRLAHRSKSYENRPGLTALKTRGDLRSSDTLYLELQAFGPISVR